MQNIENDYNKLVLDLMLSPEKADRTGTGTKSLFGRTIRHDMSTGFPLLNGKRVYYKQAFHELLWIAQGRTDMEYLHENGVKYWDADYERSGRTDNTLGPVYGKQWRDFEGVDQLLNLIDEIKSNPTSRRLIVSAWAPQDMSKMVLPPCHYAFQVYVNEGKLSLMWQQRSADVFLGLPYDIAMYGLLLEMLAKGADLKPGDLIGQLGDCHLYNDHLKQAGVYLSRVHHERDLPKLQLSKGITKNEYNQVVIPNFTDILIEGYDPLPPISAPLSVGK
ncbi:MAG: thymidylate synthase [Methylophagaceae bacterium]|jgi:thymidylate synthase